MGIYLQFHLGAVQKGTTTGIPLERLKYLPPLNFLTASPHRWSKPSLWATNNRDVLEAKVQFLDYKLIMEKLSALDGVVLYKGRAVIPPSLRAEVLSILHSAPLGSKQHVQEGGILCLLAGNGRGHKEDQTEMRVM